MLLVWPVRIRREVTRSRGDEWPPEGMSEMWWRCVWSWMLGLLLCGMAIPAKAAFVEVRGPDRVAPGEEFRIDAFWVMTEDADASIGQGIAAFNVDFLMDDGVWVDISSQKGIWETLPCDSEFCVPPAGPVNQLRSEFVPDVGTTRVATDAAIARFGGLQALDGGFSALRGQEIFVGHAIGRAEHSGDLKIRIGANYGMRRAAFEDITSPSPASGDIVKTIVVPEPLLPSLLLLCGIALRGRAISRR